MMYQLQGLLGMAVLLGLAWVLSEDRKRVPWRLVGIGIGSNSLSLACCFTCRLAGPLLRGWDISSTRWSSRPGRERRCFSATWAVATRRSR
jgi:hypothetical protein